MRFARKERCRISFTQYISGSHQLLFQLAKIKVKKKKKTFKPNDTDTDTAACASKYVVKPTLSSCLELRRELMRESSDATRWRSASSSREVREMRDAAASCNSFACSTSLDTSPAAANDSPGESPISRPIRRFKI